MIDDALTIIARQPGGDRALRALALPAGLRLDQLRLAVRVADLSGLIPEEREAVAQALASPGTGEAILDRRSKIVLFRVTPDERATIALRAETAGMDVSSYLRAVALADEGQA